MKKKIIIVGTFLVILFVISAILLIIKPLWLSDFRDVLANSKNTFIVEASKEYKDLRTADKSKKYYKGEKNIKIPILLYHSITKEKSERKDYFVRTSEEQFEKQISGLINLGYTFITYDDLIKYNNNEIALPEYVVLLTFDDGYLDNYENAFPILQKYNIPATIFVIDSCVGCPRIFFMGSSKRYGK